jgi:hypothetical protein
LKKCSAQIGIAKNGLLNVIMVQISTARISITEVDAGKTDFLQINKGEVGILILVLLSSTIPGHYALFQDTKIFLVGHLFSRFLSVIVACSS